MQALVGVYTLIEPRNRPLRDRRLPSGSRHICDAWKPPHRWRSV